MKHRLTSTQASAMPWRHRDYGIVFMLLFPVGLWCCVNGILLSSESQSSSFSSSVSSQSHSDSITLSSSHSASSSSRSTSSSSYPGDTLTYAFDAISHIIVTFMIPSLKDWRTLCFLDSESSFVAGDFAKDEVYMYMIDASGGLYSVNIDSCASTFLGNIKVSLPVSGLTWWSGSSHSQGACKTGCAFITATDSETISILYQLDLYSDVVVATEVGAVPGAVFVGITSNAAEGILYALDSVSDTLVRVDPNTAQPTTIGPLGLSASYAVGLDFDEGNHVLYMVAYYTSLRSQLCVTNTSTGTSNAIEDFPYYTKIVSLSIVSDYQYPENLTSSSSSTTQGDQWSLIIIFVGVLIVSAALIAIVIVVIFQRWRQTNSTQHKLLKIPEQPAPFTTN
ncbi:hypothetical protein Pelo_8471 [Pelomyxa schiedti]|nr:hypothetical protein Pelo_8471 [Pelomyxa schiedti]